MSNGAVAYPLHPRYHQEHKLLERDKLLIEFDDLHHNTPIAFAVAMPARVLVADNQIAYFPVHHIKDKLANIFDQRKRSLEKQHPLIIIIPAPSLGIGYAMDKAVG